ncbi:hypothetical protein [Nocardiopsis metallicus]|uniref:Uncharacterized protein n=1 Tax=Nocardiopsis metallicus TaxID=179819 RepID=A0A840WAW5_9ACTN|nr:hypothetical protein [Nocardiopsis metallicus]MBB5489185.1 hypothetical protein [Nocardiopsis metallicus]
MRALPGFPADHTEKGDRNRLAHLERAGAVLDELAPERLTGDERAGLALPRTELERRRGRAGRQSGTLWGVCRRGDAVFAVRLS